MANETTKPEAMANSPLPDKGVLSYDGMRYLFLGSGDGPRIFAEIRGYGSGLQMDANAQRLCDLWNSDALAAAKRDGIREGLEIAEAIACKSMHFGRAENIVAAIRAKANEVGQ